MIECILEHAELVLEPVHFILGIITFLPSLVSLEDGFPTVVELVGECDYFGFCFQGSLDRLRPSFTSFDYKFRVLRIKAAIGMSN